MNDKLTVKPPSAELRETQPLSDSRLLKIAAVVSVGPFLTLLDTTVVNIALSTLSHELHAPLSLIQWVTTGYLLALALMIPLNSWLVNYIGAKRVYIFCFASFTLASVCCGLSTSAQMLIVFRIFQGLAGGLLAPMAQMMVARHSGDRMARMMVFVSVPALMAPILGPFVAGSILHLASWNWIFFLNLPIALSAMVLAAILLPADEELQRRKLDVFGLLLISPGLVLLLDGLNELSTKDARSLLHWCEVLAACVMIVCFVLRSWRLGSKALIDVRLFKGPIFAASATTQFFSNATTQGGQMLIPLYLLFTIKMDPATAGLLISIMGVGVISSRPFIDRSIQSFGPKSVSVAGGIISLAATIPFVFSRAGLSIFVIAALLFVRGFGLGIINLPSFVSAYSAVPRSLLTDAATSINIVQRLGGPIATMAIALALEHAANAATQVTAQSADVMKFIPPEAFPAAFGLLCAVNFFCLIAAMTLPQRV